MALSSRGNPANAQYLRDIENDPTQRMHGNQPGVPTATGGTMSVATDPSKMGAERFTTTDGPPAASMAPGGGVGSTDEAYLRDRVRGVFAEYGRMPREDEYQQWLKYMQTPDVDGTGRRLLGWDPYWESRLRMHATGDYYGNGTTPDAVGRGQIAARLRAGLGPQFSQVSALQSLMQPTASATSVQPVPGATNDAGVVTPEALPTLNVAALNAVQQPTEQEALRYLMSQERR